MQDSFEGYRLSPQQAGLWRALGEMGVTTAHAEVELRLAGPLDPERLRAALAAVARNHEVLRTVFRRLPGMGQPVQVITDQGPRWSEWHGRTGAPAAGAALGPVSPGPGNESDGSASGPARVAADASMPQTATTRTAWIGGDGPAVDLEHGPILAAMLVRRATGEHHLALKLPALNADTRSLLVLCADLRRAYADPSTLNDATDTPLQYADLSEWAHDLLDTAEGEAGRAYWRAVAVPPAVRLPWERAEAGVPFAPAAVLRPLPASVAASLARTARAAGLGRSDLVLAAWHTLLRRLTGHAPVATDVVFDGRVGPELAGALGPLARALPVGVAFTGETPLLDLARRLRLQIEQHGGWQEYHDGQIGGGSSARPWCFEAVDLGGPEMVGGVTFTVFRAGSPAGHHALLLRLLEGGDRPALELVTDTAVVSADEAERLLDRLMLLLQGVAVRPDAVVDSVPLLLDGEPDRFGPAAGAAAPPLVTDLIAATAHHTPDALALVDGDERVSYGALAARAWALAGRLHHRRTGAEAPVGVFLDRSAAAVIALVGVLQAGCTAVPLDPLLPDERLVMMLAGSGCRVVVTDAALRPRLPVDDAAVILLDTDGFTPADGRTPRPPAIPGGALPGADPSRSGTESGPPRPDAHTTAYILHTSGSTGTPKAIAVEHRQIAHYLAAITERLGLGEGTSYALLTSLATDLGYTSLWPALCGGGLLVLLSPADAADPARMAATLRRQPVDCLKITPSHLGALLAGAGPAAADLLPRRCLVLGGEAAGWPLVDQVRALAPDLVIVNHYGPTETTVGVLAGRIDDIPETDRPPLPPLGAPLAGTTAYVLEDSLLPVPPGYEGELVIGGAQVARGYVGDAPATAGRFLPDPFTGRPGGRLYRTGDRVQALPGGGFLFLGRADGQVKVRGFRVELGEIESALAAAPAIREAAVVAIADEAAGTRLAAFVVPSSSGERPDAAALRARLADRLPEYMLPAALITRAALPRTASGKVDRQALAAEAAAWQGERPAYVPVDGPAQAAIAAIWTEVLAVDQVGADDNFFALGGHSLLAMQVIARVRQAFGLAVPIRALFAAPTVAGLAEAVAAMRHNGEQAPVESAIVPAPRDRYRRG